MISLELARQMRGAHTLSGDRNQCGECGLLFVSAWAYARHRTGLTMATRRCLSPAEMRDRGLTLDRDGFWMTYRLSVEELEQAEQADMQHARDAAGLGAAGEPA
jgi:hypothetical protein